MLFTGYSTARGIVTFRADSVFTGDWLAGERRKEASKKANQLDNDEWKHPSWSACPRDVWLSPKFSNSTHVVR